MTPEKIAKVAHELNKSYCEAIGDNSQPSWNDAPEWQKNSAINGVKFHLENPDATPEQSHESWLKQKEAEGWKYGEVKNPETKEHPCFRPYNELPVEQRVKDYLFRQTIHSLKPFLSLAEPDVTKEVKGVSLANDAKHGDGTSIGERRVRSKFNPAANGPVDAIKQKTAELINFTEEVVSSMPEDVRKSGEVLRLKSLAQTSYEEAAMWAVKVATANS